MMKRLPILAAVAVLICSGCGAHGLIFKNRYEVHRTAGVNLPPHTGKVLVTPNALAAGIGAEEVGIIRVGKVYYDTSEWALQAFAVKAREIGANAVVEARTWRQPSAWAWATPHGTGRAVYIKNPDDPALNAAGGQWY